MAELGNDNICNEDIKVDAALDENVAIEECLPLSNSRNHNKTINSKYTSIDSEIKIKEKTQLIENNSDIEENIQINEEIH